MLSKWKWWLLVGASVIVFSIILSNGLMTRRAVEAPDAVRPSGPYSD